MKKCFMQVAIGAACFFLFSCVKPEQENLVEQETELLQFPNHFPEPNYKGGELEVSEASISLGRHLFYDPILSVDSTISCGSCHAQVHAFADHGVALSTGVQGRLGTRNAPALANLAWHTNFMHDGGINHLEVLPLAPITAEFEMDQSMEVLLNKLKNHPNYPARFQEAFPDQEINTKRLFVALAHFQACLISANSKYDRVMLGTDVFTPAESEGFKIFEAQCASCHTPPLFTDFSFANNGLYLEYSDAGRATITQNEEDAGLFKVPSLRNVTMTYPYMHDGSMYTLNAVLDHYVGGVKEHENLDSRMDGVQLTESQKSDVLAFIRTLSDFSFISNPKHSEPQ